MCYVTVADVASLLKKMIIMRTASEASEGHVLCAVWEIEEMRHGNKWVVERFDGGDSLVCVDGQHLGQQVDELSPVSFLCQQVAPF